MLMERKESMLKTKHGDAYEPEHIKRIKINSK
jgi:hypothetical protein